MSFGKTIFQRRMEQKLLDADRMRNQVVEDRNYNLRASDLALRTTNASNEAQRADFWQKLQMANMMGKASYFAPDYQPTGGTPELQEGIDLGRASGAMDDYKLSAKARAEAERQASINGRNAIQITSREGMHTTDHIDKLLGFGDQNDRAALSANVTMRGQDMGLEGRKYAADRMANSFGPWEERQGNTLRDDLQKGESFKNAQRIQSTYKKMKSAGPGIGDIGLIVGYWHMIEADSHVTEGEFETGKLSQPMPAKVEAYWNSLTTGGVVAEQTRKQILAESDALYSAAMSGYQDQLRQFENIARRQKVNIQDLGGNIPDARSQGGAVPSGYNDGLEE